MMLPSLGSNIHHIRDVIVRGTLMLFFKIMKAHIKKIIIIMFKDK